MEEFITLGQKLATVSFGILMFVVLVGSYFDVWRWGRAVREMEKKHAAEIAEIKAEKDEWKKLALSAGRLSETSLAAMLEEFRSKR